MVIELVDCSREYWEFVRNLRNDERVKDGFIETTVITSEQQERYMSTNESNYKVALFDGVPVGYVGVIDNDIRICTHPEYQKKGVAKFMLQQIIKEYPNSFGKVKVDNHASINLFKSLGFEEKFIIFTKNKQ